MKTNNSKRLTDRMPRLNDERQREISNRILRSLPRREVTTILPQLEFMQLAPHQIMGESGETIRSGYFLNEGVASVLTTQPDGGIVDVGFIDNEGFVGLPVIFGFKSSGVRVMMHGDGTAYRIDVGVLLSLLPKCPFLRQQLQRFSMFLNMQTTQLAACNCLHSVVERLARWLLMSQDRNSRREPLPLTQEFLGQMLGTRRATITSAAGSLQKAGLIKCSRGSVSIIDRHLLESEACSCYRLIEQQKRKWELEIT